MCTGIKVNYPGGAILGRSMDIEAPVDYRVLYQPTGYPCADNLLGGQHLSRYPVIGVGFRTWDPLKDGMNTHGLIGVTNEFFGMNLYAKTCRADKVNVSAYHFMTYALANFRSVAELVEALPHIHIATRDIQGNKVISPEFHYMFTDGSQRCIVIEPANGTLTYHENPYDVMTNSPKFDTHIKRLNGLLAGKPLAQFNAAKSLPGGYDPISRFIKAYYMLKTNEPAETQQAALAQFYSLIGAVSLPKGFIKNQRYQSTTFTTYVSAYDTQQKQLTIRSIENPNVYQVGFEDVKDVTQKQIFEVNQPFSGLKLG